MHSFADMNPAAAAAAILLTACITIFCMEPLLLGLSLLAAIAYYLLVNGRQHAGFHIGALGVPALFALLNPLWNQHGVSVLFVINDRAVTSEALIYGAVTGIRLAAVLYWFRIFSDLMNSEKLFYLFRFLSPKLALVLSMAIRNLALFRRQMQRIQYAQRGLGLYREGHFIDDVRGGLRVFSVLLTWALENGIVTANSMTARGYGTSRRTSYVTFRWRRCDVILLLSALLLGAGAAWAIAAGVLNWQYYPTIAPPVRGAAYFTGILAYALLAFLPLIYEGRAMLRWKHLRSGI